MQSLIEIAIAIGAGLLRDVLPPNRSIVISAAKSLTPTEQHEFNLNPPRHPIKRKKPKRKPAEPFTMYDAVDTSRIPDTAAAVAGYVNGDYITIGELDARFPHAKLLTVSVNADGDADCLDVETGDATPGQAPTWVRRQHARGVARPCIYANRSTMPAVWEELQQAGFKRAQVRLWVADWTGAPHIPAGYDACQWYGGITAPYDQSLCLPEFLR